MKRKPYGLLIMGLISLSGLLPSQQVEAGKADEETIKQISRQISSVITQKLGQDLTTNRQADSDIDKLNGFWATTSYTNIAFKGADIDIDIYQLTGGIDRKFGKFNVGTSLTYARAEADFFKSNQISFTPYASYKFTKNIFVAALGGYVRNQGDDSDGINSDTAIMDISLNGVLPVYQQLFFKPKAGYRFAYTALDTDLPIDDAISHTYYAQGEISYHFDNFKPYFNTLYELSEPEEGSSSDSIFIAIGTHYQAQDNLSFGLGYRHQVNKSNIDYHQGVAEMRLSF